jgi:glycosyl transferase family 25
MSIFDVFERIYLINLPERTDRLREALAELGQAGLARDDARLRIFAGVRPADAGNFPSRGAHGCHLSHLSIIREVIRDGLQNVLIIEDDIALHPECMLKQPTLAGRLAQGDWDFAYPGHNENLRLEPGAAAHWQTTQAPLVCAHFYALHRRVLQALESYLTHCMQRPAGHPDGGPMHIDGAYSMFRSRQPDVVTLISAPSLGGQRSSRSDIYPNRWFDRMPVLRFLAGQARGLRNRHHRFLELKNAGEHK